MLVFVLVLAPDPVFVIVICNFCNLVLWQRRTAPLASTSGSKAKGPKLAQKPSNNLRPLPNAVVDPTHSYATLSGAMRCGRAAHPSFKGKSTLRSIPRPSRLAAPADRCRVKMAVGSCNRNVDADSLMTGVSKTFRNLDKLCCNHNASSFERRTP